MHQILHKAPATAFLETREPPWRPHWVIVFRSRQVQSEVGGWVGLSVVHLGARGPHTHHGVVELSYGATERIRTCHRYFKDRDVPNALVFIDKCAQVPLSRG